MSDIRKLASRAIVIQSPRYCCLLGHTPKPLTESLRLSELASALILTKHEATVRAAERGPALMILQALRREEL